MDKPTQKENIDWTDVVEMAQDHLDTVGEVGFESARDVDHYIFEEVMKAIYGDNVFDWYNKHE